MQLRRLSLRGIGPFGGSVSIDFDRLSVGGLYLLDGPTGSGKSTIIDAITWALYGGVAGGEDSTDERVRSTHVSAEVESFVDLVFSVEAGTFRIRRTPAWTKPGNKNPTAPTATLWRLAEASLESGDLDAGEVLETKPSGVTPAVTALLGLNRQQFVQTIVLPQGKFADFLRLNSKDRTRLLEQIFATATYRRVSDALQERARAAERTIADTRERFISASDDLLSTAAPEDAATLGDTVRGAVLPREVEGQLRARFSELVTNAEHDVSTALRHKEASDRAEQLAADSLRETEELAKRLARRSSALERRRILLERTPEIATVRDALDMDAKAGRLLPLVQAHAAAETRLADTHRRLNVLKIDPHSVSEGTLADARRELVRLNELSGMLAELTQLEEQVAVTTTQQDADRKALRTLVQEHAQKEEEAAAAERRRQVLLQEQEAATSRAAHLAGAQRDLEAAQQLGEQARKLRGLHSELEECEAHVVQLTQAFQDARSHEETLTDAWIASTAPQLAVTLKDGVPCPVCGSCEHPAPAPASAVLASREDVDRAARLREAARHDLSDARERLAGVRTQVDELTPVLSGLSTDQVEEGIARAEAEVAAATRAASKAQALRNEIAELSTTAQRRTEELQALASRTAALDSAIRERGERLAADQERLSAQREGYSSITERRAAHAEQLCRQQETVEALADLLHQGAQAAESKQELAAAIDESEFADASAVRAAVLPAQDAEAARVQVQEHRDALRDVERDLAQPELATLRGDEQANVSEAQAAYEAAHADANEARDRAAEATSHHKQIAAQFSRVETRYRAWQEAYHAAGASVRLAELAKAGPASVTHVPLPTYVLQRRFEHVVERANEHLTGISQGRYELVRTDEKEKGSRQIQMGLGLLVIDHLGDPAGDTLRSTRSLSGGETFYVSLALALALAGVVQEENGGIQLDTLMIDEGFGSLDADVLDQVMQCLTSLANGGRTVAVVSHVEELRKIIAEQIIVIPQPDGSSTLEVQA